MSIINIQSIEVGQVGVSPRTVKMLSTDNLTTITTAGYITQSMNGGPFSSKDIFEVIYGSDSNGLNGTYGVFTPSISNGTVTLVRDAGGLTPSDSSNTIVVTSPGSLTIGNILKSCDANGTLADAGYNMQIAEVSMTLADFQGMYTTPKLILAAAGANTIIVLHKAWINFIYGSAQLTSGGNVAFIYGNGSHIGAGAIQATATEQTADFTGATASTWYTFTPQTGNNTQLALASVANTGIYLSNATTTFATGTGGSFLVRMLYSILPTNA